MPRISTSLIRKALKESYLLPYLLPANHSIEAAKQELQWIKNELPQSKWLSACKKRSNSIPLQYILGSQPFGSIDIICQKNVLIPRWETEEWCLKLINSLKSLNKLNILDICSGSGCIPLLIKKELNHVNIKGFDISDFAIDLSRKNARNLNLDVEFIKKDLFSSFNYPNIDLIISNPPYIPIHEIHSISRSTLKYEPKLALIDNLNFYQELVNKIKSLDVNGFILELGYLNQYNYLKEELMNYECLLYKDSASNERCIIGFKKGSNMEVLKKILE